MGLKITKRQINSPLLIEILKKLSVTFQNVNTEFLVIGATARDIILQVLADVSSERKTRDLDLAIAIPDWKNYEILTETLLREGFQKCKNQKQRFFYKDYGVDIVPYGELAHDDGFIYWPPEETVAMSVKGYEEILRQVITVSIDDEFEIKIPSLQGLFLLKLNAWIERNISTDKDAEDMWFIIDNYYFANDNRGFHPEVYDTENFDTLTAGSYWLAHDIANLVGQKTLKYFSDFLENELSKDDESRLFMQIDERKKSASISEIKNAFRTMVEVFHNYIKD